MSPRNLTDFADPARLLATAAPGMFDDVARLAARLCDAPVALVTLLDADSQHALAVTGAEVGRLPRSISFCHYTAMGREPMEVADLSADPRFAANPLVTGEHHARFYAGAPMVTAAGSVLGSVCVVDRVPRTDGLTPVQRDGLVMLAEVALGRLEGGAGCGATARALADSEDRFRTLADTMPQMVWSTLPDGYHDYYNARWYEFTGAPPGTTDGEGWNGMFHQDDQDRAWRVWRHSLATGDPYQIEYRLRHFDDTYRWVLGRALPIRDAETGAITRWFGTCTDIHEQKLALDEREVVSQELSHRIKNIFAVISGLVTIAARTRPQLKPLVDDLRDRIIALGRAHDFVRPHSPASRTEARPDSLYGLLADLFRPYEGGERITIVGDDAAIDDRSATPLALLFHELATNATKYGALSTAEGRVTLAIAAGPDRTAMTWRERGGPVVREPSATGFGSQLVELSAVRQLGGTVTRDWAPDGLTMTIDLPSAVLSRRPTPSAPGPA